MKLVIAVGVLLFASALPVSAAEYYRWVDANGVVHITDNLHNVPPNQRPKAGRIQGTDTPPPPPPVAQPQTTPRKASIPIEMRGSVVIVPAMLNNRQAVKFVVDTGAGITMISNSVARELALDLAAAKTNQTFQTANGQVQAPVANIDSITVGGMEIRNIATAVHDGVPDPAIAGLLGLNFLSNFRLDIDTQRRMLHLEKK